MSEHLAFIGAGRMAGAMVRGIISNGVFAADEIVCTGARDGTAESLAEETGIRYTFDWEDLLEGTDWVVLACKPQQLSKLPQELAKLTSNRKVLSILAGTTLERLQATFPGSSNIIRCMPNTPGMIGKGITAYSPLFELGEEEAAQVERMLQALGDVVALPESFLDAVTGLSGSGPAYVFEFAAALRDGGVAAGLDSRTAYKLALKTIQGAAALLEAVPETPETHRDWVSSPGGTTLAGLRVMQDAGFRDILQRTIEAAAGRSRELSES